MPWFDAGVNLLDSRFDVDDVISRALDSGVERMLVITTSPNDWAAAAALYQRYPSHLSYTIGIHPHDAKSVDKNDLITLKKMAEQPGVVAIGECGLDFNRNFSPPDVQIAIFEQQLSIASEMELPVYLHERDAFDTQVACLGKYPETKGVAHCFTGTSTQLETYLAMGLYVGITGWICDDKRGQSLRDAVTSLPLERIILETDAPYLFPKDLRPKKRNNEPAYLGHIGAVVGDIINVDTEVVKQHSYANTCRLFGIID